MNQLDMESNLIPVNGIFGYGGNNVARRRFQRGCVYLENGNWLGRWRADEVDENGQTKRKLKCKVIGSKKEFPTKRLAERQLEMELAEVNALTYKAKPTTSFEVFAKKWELTVLPTFKPSTQAAISSQLRKWLLPQFSGVSLTNISTEILQHFVAGLSNGATKCSAKTVKNLIGTLRILWKTARAWGLVTFDPFEAIVLPKRQKVEVRFFTAEEMRRIIEAAKEPHKTFFWLAAETGMRAGELTGLRWEDVDLETGTVRVRQSCWRGQIGDPKTQTGLRAFAISDKLCQHLDQLARSTLCSLLFFTRTGRPWDSNLVVKRKLHPLLRRLGIDRAGLHAFRHGNATVLDQAQVPMRVRQNRLGHADAEMTAHYTHVVSADDQRAAAELEKLIFGSGVQPRTALADASGHEIGGGSTKVDGSGVAPLTAQADLGHPAKAIQGANHFRWNAPGGNA